MSDPVAAPPAATDIEEKVAPEEEEGFRVYVGNLAYSSTEEQVREFLAPAGGEILSITFPSRFKRPGGYAFVAYSTEEAAKKVVETLNDQVLSERTVHLEQARTKAEAAALKKEALQKKKAAKAAAKAEAGEAAAPAAAAGEGAEVNGEEKKKKKKTKAAARRRLPEEGEEGAEVNGEDGEAKPKKAPREKKPKEARIDQPGVEGEEKAPKEKKPRKPRMELSGELSKTSVFVANLPFSVTDETLAALFTDLSIKVKSAHVVQGIRKSSRGGRPFRASKGFGFVEVEDPAQQQEAVQKVDGTLIEERTITAKVANEMKPVEVQEAVEAETT
ncbi:hypothetical protein P7C73_g5625, partial [Tremellales sp. Uapishka_1]